MKNTRGSIPGMLRGGIRDTVREKLYGQRGGRIRLGQVSQSM